MIIYPKKFRYSLIVTESEMKKSDFGLDFVRLLSYSVKESGNTPIHATVLTEDPMDTVLSEDEKAQVRAMHKAMLGWDWTVPMATFRSYPEGENLSDAEAADLLDAYVRFMATCAVLKGRPFVVSYQVDPFWHNHVLHTMDYQNFCTEFAGTTLHHYPTIKGFVYPALAKHYLEGTVPVLSSIFGPDEKHFPTDENACVCTCAAQCASVDPEEIAAAYADKYPRQAA